MLKAYKYRIKPTEEQKTLLAKHFGCARFVYNNFLSERIEFYKENKDNPTKKGLSYYDTQKMLTEMKKQDEYSFLKEVNSQSLQVSIQNLDIAYKDFFKNKKSFPKYKNKRSKQSFNIPQNVKVDFDKGIVITPKFLEGIKTIFHRTFEGKVKQATISKTLTGKYFVSILVDNNKELPVKEETKEETSIGIDLGLKDFAILSNETKIENPKFLKQIEKIITRLNRQLQRKEIGSKKREKTRLRLSKAYEKLSNKRLDFLNKLSDVITKQFDTIIIEDLGVKNLVRNKKLSKSISYASWGEFIRQLKYKCEWRGKNLIVIDRFFPSSKSCNVCGYINQDLTLDIRDWTCPVCGTNHDRDINASKNIKKVGLNSIIRDGTPEFKQVDYALMDDRSRKAS